MRLVMVDHAYANREWVGLEVFLSFLSADQKITEKCEKDLSNKNYLLLILTYKNWKKKANEMADFLKYRISTIQGIDIRTEITNTPITTISKHKKIAGIYITERYNRYSREEDIFKQIIAKAKDKHVILFSPFESDVEKGCTAGFVVSDIVLPYVNLSAVERSNIQLNNFFLRIAETFSEK